MNLEKYLPLTETTYYILLSLLEPGHGYAVMQKAEELSEGRVRIAAGTMYGALDNLSKQKLIVAVPSDDPRRKNYKTTEEGRKVLEMESRRLEQMLKIYKKIQEENNHEEI